jgi:N utilization substance protein B
VGARRKSRETALQILCLMDASGVDASQGIELFWANLGHDDEGREFADELVRGCGANLEAIDARIRSVSKHWRLERMARVDRNIIRMGTHELCDRSDIPVRVTLNEAIEIAKRFGDEQSPAFVNGVLDRIAIEAKKE